MKTEYGVTNITVKINARWVTCATWTGSGETEGEHSYKDNCWNCAPFWWEIPICPLIGDASKHNDRYIKLKPSGYCKGCKKFFSVERPPTVKER